MPSPTTAATITAYDGIREHERSALAAAFHRVLESGNFILGAEVRAFEREFADWLGAPHCIGVGNGTDALEIALKACGVQAGDRVACVANAANFASTAITACGAEPVWFDISPRDGLLNIAALESASTPISAVIATHLYGQPVDLRALTALCRRRGWRMIEDCAQAHGAARDGLVAGTVGDAAAFSFYPTKNLGALGDGGAVVCSDAAVAEAARSLRQYGWRDKYTVDRLGGRNTRLDELQAAFLRVRLPALHARNDERVAVVSRLRSEIANPALRFPTVRAGAVFHQCVALTEARESLLRHLRQNDISAGIHYPLLDTTAAHRVEHLPASAAWCGQVVSLPCHGQLSDADVCHIIATCNRWEPATS